MNLRQTALAVLAVLLAPLHGTASAGSTTVTGTVLNPSPRPVRDADGTEHTPSFELRIPRWDPSGCYRADGTPASSADLEAVDIELTQLTHTWTWVTNQSSMPRGWWQLAGGATVVLSRASMEGILRPEDTGLLCWQGARTEYLATSDHLDGGATATGYYWGPTAPGLRVWIGEGDRAAVNLWTRPSPGCGNSVRRFISPRAAQTWSADSSGHIAWTTRVEVGFEPTCTVTYRYRDVPTGRHLRAVQGQWARTPLGYSADVASVVVDGLPPELGQAAVRRVVLEHNCAVAASYGIENESAFAAVCGGGGYAGSFVDVNGTGTLWGTSLSFGVGSSQAALPLFDGTQDWSGASGLFVRAGRYFSTGEIAVATLDSDLPAGACGAMDAWALPYLTQPALTITHTRVPGTGVYPQAVTPGASFGWDGRVAIVPETRVVWFVQL